MWKCATRTIKAQLCKSILKCNTVLSTKAQEDKVCPCLLKLAPLLNRLNYYFGCCKTIYGSYSSQDKEKDGPKKRKKSSFLEDLDSNVFDALRWSGVFVTGYYFLQPFSRKRLSATFNPYENHPFPTLYGYQQTILYLYDIFKIKSYNCILPEVRAAKSNKSQFREPASVQSEKENYSNLEKAHQIVLGTLRNWIGTQYMQLGKHAEALGYFTQAAEEENPAGIFNLGICHERGLGTSQNFKRAAELYQKAADLGHATAMYNLGVFYVQGLGGVEADVDRARELFKAAANLGQSDAKKALILEKQSTGEVPENIQILRETENKHVKFSQLMSDDFISQSSNLHENCNCDGTVKNVRYYSLDFAECKERNSTFDSDSGVLDLSPPDESEVLVV